MSETWFDVVIIDLTEQQLLSRNFQKLKILSKVQTNKKTWT